MHPLGRFRLKEWLSHVHPAVVWYAALGLLDFGFSVMAFKLGYGESNPVLAWYKQHGLFELAKIGSTVVVILLGFFLWEQRVVRAIIYIADLAMLALLVYHLVFWINLLSKLNIYKK